MFTGLVYYVAQVLRIESKTNQKTFVVSFKDTALIKVGDSISINGACQTATQIFDDSFSFTAYNETLKKTNLSLLKEGDFVNTELSLLASDRMGGHMVSGHVNVKCEIEYLDTEYENIYLGVKIPDEFMPYCIDEGSVAIDGISLTIAKVENNTIRMNIISHTLQNTNLKYRKTGDLVNVEFDMMAKYIVNFLSKFKNF